MLWTGLFSIVLAVANNYGSRIVIGDSPYNDLMDASYVTPLTWTDAIGIPVLAVILYRAIAVLRILRQKVHAAMQGRQILRSREVAPAVPAVVIFLCWLPYYVLYYPGIVLGDSVSQIEQALGNWVLQNHHPVMHTQFIRLCIWLGSLYGDLTLGIAIYSIVQMLLLAAMYGYMIAWLSRKRVPMIALVCITAFYALMPFFGAMSIAMWKDPLFGTVGMVLSLELYDYVAATMAGDREGQRRRLCRILIEALALAFLRNNGVYILLFALLVLLVIALLRSNLRRGCINLMLSMLAVVSIHSVITGPVYTRLGVMAGEKVESVGLFLNQMASVAAADDGVMSDEDAAFMDHLLPLEQYAEKYRPCVVDKLKWDNEFDGTYLSDHMPEFVRTYLSLGMKNPGKYIDAWAMMTFGYWAPDYWQFNSDKWNVPNGDFNIVANSDLDIRQTPLYELPTTGRYGIFTLYGSMISLGLVDWMMLFACLVLITRRDTAGITAMTISLGALATMLIASPFYYWQRYGTIQYDLLPVYLYFLARRREPIGTLFRTSMEY